MPTTILSVRVSPDLLRRLEGLADPAEHPTRSRLAALALAAGVEALEATSGKAPEAASEAVTDDDVGEWVRIGADNRRLAHRLAGVEARYACGHVNDLPRVRRAPAGRRCARCEALARLEAVAERVEAATP